MTGGITAGVFADDAFTGTNITVSNKHAVEVTSDENWWGSTAGIVFNSNSESATRKLDGSVVCGNDVNGSATEPSINSNISKTKTNSAMMGPM